MSVAVLIPFASSDPHRLAALDHTTRHYRTLGWPVHTGTTEGPWCKARAVDAAAQQTTADLYLIADADCICPDTLQAVQAVTEGAPWATPHRRVHRLTEQATANLYGGDRTRDRTEERHPATRGGGIVAIPADTWHTIPLDPRFTGWGHEDLSWALALDRLAGEGWRGDSVITHLWHPHPDRDTRRIGSQAGRLLERRYWNARHDPDVMQALVDEAKEALWTPVDS